MHVLYFTAINTAINKEEAKTSEEARERAMEILDTEDFAGTEGGYFLTGGKADWYVVGGRWSGLFTELSDAGQKAFAEIAALKEQRASGDKISLRGVYYGDSAKEALKNELLAEAEIIH